MKGLQGGGGGNRYLQGFLLFCIAHSYRNLQRWGGEYVLPSGLAVLQEVSGSIKGAFRNPTLTQIIRMNSGSDPEEFCECQEMLRFESYST